jgi:hypothetical protein
MSEESLYDKYYVKNMNKQFEFKYGYRGYGREMETLLDFIDKVNVLPDYMKENKVIFVKERVYIEAKKYESILNIRIMVSNELPNNILAILCENKLLEEK